MECGHNFSLEVFKSIVIESFNVSSLKFMATIAILSFLFLKAVGFILFEQETLLVLDVFSTDL